MSHSEANRNTPRHPALVSALEVGRSRSAVESAYLEAREAFILAAQQLDRYGKRYREVVGRIPKSVDLSQYAETSREPMTPTLPVATELEWSDE